MDEFSEKAAQRALFEGGEGLANFFEAAYATAEEIDLP